MGNHCDIYNVTQKSCKKTATGGLHYEQKVYKGVFQSDIRSLPQGFKKDQAHNLKRILYQFRLQQKVCHSEIEWSFSGKARYHTSAAETYIWDKSHINSDCRVGSSRLSVFGKAKGFDKTLDAMDWAAISIKSDITEAVAVYQRQADRPQTQRQEGSG